MATGRPIRGKASKVGQAVYGMPLTTDTNPLDDRADNAKLAVQGKGVKRVPADTVVPGAGARGLKGRKVRGGGDITGGAR